MVVKLNFLVALLQLDSVPLFPCPVAVAVVIPGESALSRGSLVSGKAPGVGVSSVGEDEAVASISPCRVFGRGFEWSSPLSPERPSVFCSTTPPAVTVALRCDKLSGREGG